MNSANDRAHVFDIFSLLYKFLNFNKQLIYQNEGISSSFNPVVSFHLICNILEASVQKTIFSHF